MIPGAFAIGSVTIAETSDGLKADLNAVFPALTADLTAFAPSGAAVGATLPALTASLTSIAPVAATVVGALMPPLMAVVVATAPAGAHILATLPALRANWRLVTETRRNIRDWQQCPRPASGFTSSGRIGTLREGPQS